MRETWRRVPYRIPHPASRIPSVRPTVPAPSPTPSSVPSAAPAWRAPRATARAAVPRSSATRAIVTPVERVWPRDSGEDGRGRYPLPSSCICASPALSLCHLQWRSAGVTRLTLRIGVVVAGLAVVGTTARAQRRGGGRRAGAGGPPAAGAPAGGVLHRGHPLVGGPA